MWIRRLRGRPKWNSIRLGCHDQLMSVGGKASLYFGKGWIHEWFSVFIIPFHRTGPDNRIAASFPDAQKRCPLLQNHRDPSKRRNRSRWCQGFESQFLVSWYWPQSKIPLRFRLLFLKILAENLMLILEEFFQSSRFIKIQVCPACYLSFGRWQRHFYCFVHRFWSMYR